MTWFRYILPGIGIVIAASSLWPRSVDAQTFACPNGPGPGEIQVGATGGSGGVAVIPVCASDESGGSQDDGAPSDNGPVWESRWGAIARGEAGGWGAVTGMRNEKSAKNAALKQCKNTANSKDANCQVPITYYDQCVAYAWGPSGGVASSAVDLGTARERAMKLCSQNSTSCEMLYSACSLPERVD